ncbi:MAG: uroporphyrinogen-III C-methyltransferase [Oscillospiraceae bacterium]|jgi:uroporphyrinogen III methyltransferase/synthase|nr:uroporphyrinogen-III C-methyltransferase [Oscillospiraceae bacterium]
MFGNGKVTLVGAGPGSAGLLTLRGLESLREADTVVCDRLVSREILELIPLSAECIYAGKESGSHAIPQEDINRLLLREAQRGKNVVRLKGGDPFLFGRGGEELELLAKHGVAFEVVPGVSSALSVPAYAGIPVTHRGYAASVHIITAHTKAGSEAGINYAALVQTKGTLVFLMGAVLTEKIASGLLAAGLPPDTPAAVIEHGTRSFQRKTLTTASELANVPRSFESPAILVIGDVCALSSDFDSFSRLPLKGRRIVVTRSREDSGRLSGLLRKLGAEVIPYHCIVTEPLPARLPDFSAFEWLVFTSPRGAAAFGALLSANSLDARVLAKLKIAAVGASTAEELKKLGLRADYVPKTYGAAALAEGLRTIRAKRILHLGAENVSLTFGASLPLYRTRSAVPQAADLSSADCVTFTSASTVRGFAESAGNCEQFKAACIGPRTAEEAAKYNFAKIAAAESATLAALCDCAVKLLETERI